MQYVIPIMYEHKIRLIATPKHKSAITQMTRLTVGEYRQDVLNRAVPHAKKLYLQ